jgi:hypothetical protein
MQFDGVLPVKMGENRGKKATVNIPDESFSHPFFVLISM